MYDNFQALNCFEVGLSNLKVFDAHGARLDTEASTLAAADSPRTSATRYTLERLLWYVHTLLRPTILSLI